MHKGQVVATGTMLAEQLGATETQIKQNFTNNKDRYEEGVHYFVLKGSDLKEFNLQVENFDLQFSPMARTVYLWTEKGAFNHVKSLGTDQAWDAFKHLVDTYFSARALADNIKKSSRQQKQIESYAKKGKDSEWIADRFNGMTVRKQLTATLKKHGVEHEGYRNITNAIYDPLYGGSTSVVREKKGLEKNDSIRDNLPRVELRAVELIEMMTMETIEKNNLRGNAQCELAAKKIGRHVANAIILSKSS